jgi:phage terminase large subunit-like protein
LGSCHWLLLTIFWHCEPKSLANGEVYLDLSDRNDLTALVGLFGYCDHGFKVPCRFWLPEENIAKLERQHQVPYRMWTQAGHITLTDGNTIDHDWVKQEIVDIAKRRNLIKLMTDPYNAKKLAEELHNDHGLPVKYIRQGYLSVSDPTKTLHELIMAARSRMVAIQFSAGTRATRLPGKTQPATSSSIRRSHGRRSTGWRR